MPDQYYDSFSFERLQERAKHATRPGGVVPENDPEALFMWQALIVATSAPGYTHLTPEEVFECLKHGVRPQQQETKNEDTAHNSRCRCHDVTTNRPSWRH